ncbi:hypothetical protein BU16DRAFT_349992 [Lophium mytilinum]|uniref:Uncharacterized protein n=1 Tax=Lophium mytilinum TaxID=390894 RepID=A0A6A6QY19_9PEZI|nr:hypothetical protein BU16DRAFT_349992 [Lophium mytilinum]
MKFLPDDFSKFCSFDPARKRTKSGFGSHTSLYANRIWMLHVSKEYSTITDLGGLSILILQMCICANIVSFSPYE